MTMVNIHLWTQKQHLTKDFQDGYNADDIGDNDESEFLVFLQFLCVEMYLAVHQDTIFGVIYI